MNLPESYKKIKKSIVAICLNEAAEFPPIIGTGFFATESGIVMTNQHIIKALSDYALVRKIEDISQVAKVLYFFNRNDGMAVLPLTVASAAYAKWHEKQELHYGDDNPDIGVLELKDVKDCPALQISDSELTEGQELAMAGFPMGTKTLKAPGWVHQVGPTLQKIMVSALLPFPCNSPHALLLDVVAQGGSSGSPIFLPNTGEVVGLLYAGLRDSYLWDNEVEYAVPTSLSLAVPGYILKKTLESIKNNPGTIPLASKTPLSDWITKQKVHQMKPKDGKGMLIANRQR